MALIIIICWNPYDQSPLCTIVLQLLEMILGLMSFEHKFYNFGMWQVFIIQVLLNLLHTILWPICTNPVVSRKIWFQDIEQKPHESIFPIDTLLQMSFLIYLLNIKNKFKSKKSWNIRSISCKKWIDKSCF